MVVPTKQQKRIIDHSDGHGIVIAGPGSGKTVTLVKHVKKPTGSRNQRGPTGSAMKGCVPSGYHFSIAISS
ncbi:AAA family ATPase [candidate division WOR-3 bacterium]|nr:AAA family ATPase [candidate division WOR-3 bacterium]